jgi:hypothetical protein
MVQAERARERAGSEVKVKMKQMIELFSETLVDNQAIRQK